MRFQQVGGQAGRGTQVTKTLKADTEEEEKRGLKVDDSAA